MDPAAEAAAAASELAGEGRLFEALAQLSSVPRADSTNESAQLRAELTQACAECNIALSGLEESESWDCVQQDSGDGLTVHYSRSGPVHSIRFSAIYQCECSTLLAFAREFDLMMEWNKYTPLTAVLDVPSLLECVCYGECWLPWPYTNRRLTVAARGVDMMDRPQRCLVAMLTGVTEEAHQLPPSAQGCVGCLIGEGSCLKLEPAEGGGVRATLVIHVDPIMPHGVPSTLMRMVFRVMSPWIHRRIQEVIVTAREDTNEYQQRIAANPELYTMLDGRFSATKPPTAPSGAYAESP